MTSPLRLRLLGALDLRDERGEECRPVLQQPKRLALLAYLACASPRRFHRRDTLLGLFWAEQDLSRARAALRRALYFLRGALGEDVLVGRGDEEVGVDGDRLWCDAERFEDALREGRAEEALSLYQGDLLEGFFVQSAPEFERWLDGERRRLRTLAAAAARRLAEEAPPGDGIGWARRTVALDPYDEAATRKLMELLERAGDRPAALQAYDRLVRRLAEDLELAPASETAALAERLRTAVAPAPAQPSRERDEPSSAPERHLVLVLPFTVRGPAELEYLAEGMVDLLSAKLDGAGGWRAVDPRTLLRRTGGAPASDWDLARGRVLAEELGADLILLGSVVAAGDRLQLAGTLHAADGSPAVSGTAGGESETELFDLVDELARQLLAGSSARAAQRVTRLAAHTTRSLPALKAWLAGEHEFRAGRFFEAMDAFGQAIAAEDGFALAHYRLAAARAACAMPGPAREASAAATRHQDRLSPHDRLLLEAQAAWLGGRADRAEALYGQIVAAYPDDVEAWFLLGDVQVHHNPYRGRSIVEARSAFERVLALDPGHVSALGHLARFAALEGRGEDLDRLVDRLLARSPAGDQALGMRALRAFSRGDTVEQERVTAELAAARALTIGIAFSDVALYAGDLGAAARLGRALLPAARGPELRTLCHGILAHLELALGRADAAWAELDRAADLDPAWALEVRGLLAALPFVDFPTAALEALHGELDRWDPGTARPSGFLPLATHNGLHRHLRLYLLGRLALRLGDPEEARARASELSALPDPEEAGGLPRGLAGALSSWASQAEGRSAEALTTLEATRPELWFQLTVASPFFAQTAERFLRADLLAEVGRVEEALRWLEVIAQRSPYELVFADPARRRRTELLRGLERPAEAERLGGGPSEAAS